MRLQFFNSAVIANSKLDYFSQTVFPVEVFDNSEKQIISRIQTNVVEFFTERNVKLKLIHENLEHDVANQCWVTSYPKLLDPSTLPNNYHAALATLRKTEQTLSKDKQWGETYQRQRYGGYAG